MASCGGTSSPRRFRSSSRSRQSCALSRVAIGEADQFLAAFRRRANQHQDALLFVFEACLEMDAIGPDVDVALCRQIAPLPRGVFFKPTVLQAADGGCRQPGSILAEQRCQSLGEVAGRDTLQVKDRKQRLDRFRAGACRAAGSTERTGCGRGRQRPPRDRGHAAGGRRPDRYRSSPRVSADDRGARRAGDRPLSSNRHVCQESPRPRPRPLAPTAHAPHCAKFR